MASTLILTIGICMASLALALGGLLLLDLSGFTLPAWLHAVHRQLGGRTRYRRSRV